MVQKITILYAMEPFLGNPNEALHLTELSRLLREPHPTVRQHLNFLEKEGILTKSKKGRLTLYRLNRNNPLLLDYAFIAEKSRLIKRCNEELVLKELVQFLRSILRERNNAIIFGSATESVQRANDIDLLITGKFNDEPVDAFSERFNVKVHIIRAGKLQKIPKALHGEITRKHLLIQGNDEVTRWLIS